jgi:ubiquitin-like-conjugating enzyme ATG10
MGFLDYPYLTRDEFTEVCHHLDRRYCQATLGPKRRRWKLRLCTALDTMFSPDGGYITYIQIIRPLEGNLDHDDLSLDIQNFSFQDNDHSTSHSITTWDQDMLDAENADEVGAASLGYVSFRISLTAHRPQS